MAKSVLIQASPDMDFPPTVIIDGHEIKGVVSAILKVGHKDGHYFSELGLEVVIDGCEGEITARIGPQEPPFSQSPER